MTALFLESSTNNDGDVWLILGLIEFIIGVVQIIGAVVRTLYLLIDKTNYKKLITYWLLVCLFISISYIITTLNGNVIYWFPFAMLIAIWYWKHIVFITNYKSKHEIL